MFKVELINGVVIEVGNKKEAEKIARKNLQKYIIDKEGKKISLNYNIKFYTIYNKYDEVVKQVDTLEEIINFFSNRYSINYIKKAIARSQLINDNYLIYGDKLNIQEV